MKRWELHRDLSASIGDYVTCTTTAIPEGVRYSALLRDSLLTRACRQIQFNAIKQVAAVPQDVASKVLMNLFPRVTHVLSQTTMIDAIASVNTALNFGIADLLHLYSVKLSVSKATDINTMSEDPLDIGVILSNPFNGSYFDTSLGVIQGSYKWANPTISVPVIDQVTATNVAYSYRPNDRRTFAHVYTPVPVTGQPIVPTVKITLSNLDTMWETFSANPDMYALKMEVAYLRLCPDFNTIDINAEVPFDETYLQEILKLAVIYAGVISQEPGALAASNADDSFGGVNQGQQ